MMHRKEWGPFEGWAAASPLLVAIAVAGCEKNPPTATSADTTPASVALQAVQAPPTSAPAVSTAPPFAPAGPAVAPVGGGGSPGAGAAGLAFTVGEPTTFATREELDSFGFQYGPADGVFGAIPLGGGRYRYFAGARASQFCRGSPGRQGIYSFTGTLDRVLDGDGCRLVVGAGDAPPGWLFDANYAGGGEVLRFAAQGRQGYLLLFHGEYHWRSPNTPDGLCEHVPCYYSSLGLAASLDEGRTFRVAGEVLQVAEPLGAVQGGGTNRNLGYGSMVVADAAGRHLPNPPEDPSRAYFYLVFFTNFPDTPGRCQRMYCTGLARAPYNDVVAAVTSGDPHAVARAFHKYNAVPSDPWAQPATSDAPDLSIPAGTHSTLWDDEPGGQMVIYDQAFGVYLMAVPSIRGIRLRASEDLLHWTRLGPPVAMPGRIPYYVTLLGESGDPTIGGPEPRLYFTTFPDGRFPNSYPNWRVSAFQTMKVHLMRAGTQP